MQSERRYEILAGLPSYGPMYIPVSDTGEPFFSEGFVVRFYKKDDTDWVANFEPGWTDMSLVADFPDANRIVVVAKGQGYVMLPEEHKPVDTFGVTIKHSLRAETGELVLADDDSVWIIGKEGNVWRSERISWDGFADLKLQSNILTGLSYDPTDDNEKWCPFTIDLVTKEITGGSYRLSSPVFYRP